MGLTQVSTDGVKNDAITKTKIPANQIEASELADNAVDTAAIADDAVTNAKIGANAIGQGELANNAVGTAQIGDGTVTEAKLGSGAVTQTKIGDGSIINAKVDNAAAIAGTKISPDFGSQNIETDGEVRTGTYIKTRVAGGGHFYLRNNSTGANYSSHLQTTSGGFDNNVQTHVHYYHSGYAELLHQGNSSVRTLSNGTQFRNGGNVNGQITPNGLCFGSDTAAANALDDYEEGSLTWVLAKKATPTQGSTNGSVVKYVKVGKLVHISGRIRTDSTSNSGSDKFIFQSSSTLPFTPETAGTSVIGHLRSQNQIDSSLTASIAWVAGSTTLYIYTMDSRADYEAVSNNVPASSQTNLVMTFSLTYKANA